MVLDNYAKILEDNTEEIEELKKDNEHQWEERCKLTFELENSTSNDKIKAKIEVMNTNIVNAEKFDCDYIGQCRFAKYVLQSLLEKE